MCRLRAPFKGLRHVNLYGWGASRVFRHRPAFVPTTVNDKSPLSLDRRAGVVREGEHFFFSSYYYNTFGGRSGISFLFQGQINVTRKIYKTALRI